MRAVILRQYGGPDRLQFVDVADPIPGHGQMRIEVAVSGVHLLETWFRRGKAVGPHPAPELPATLGDEIAGIVDAVGPDLDPHKWIGLRVAASSLASGGYAELAIADHVNVHRLPAHLSDEAAVTMLATGATAMAIIELAAITASDIIVITAAAGGIGTLLVQHARHVGATVLGAASTDGKRKAILRGGADEAVDYTAGDWALGVGPRATLVLDGVGGRVAEALYPTLEQGARVVSFGAASNNGDLTPLATPTGVTFQSLFDSPVMAQFADPIGHHRLQAAALEAAAAGKLRPEVMTYPLAAAATAHAQLEARLTTGKVLLISRPSAG